MNVSKPNQDENAAISDDYREFELALSLVCIQLPHLSGLANVVRIVYDERIETAGIFASGRLLINAVWFKQFNLKEQAFILAHELLHLALQTHQRAGEHNTRLFNIAHDYIINDMLSEELQQTVPANGLCLRGARYRSVERLVLDLDEEQSYSTWSTPHTSWRGDSEAMDDWSGVPQAADLNSSKASSASLTALASALASAGIANAAPAEEPSAEQMEKSVQSDVLPAELEREWFPESINKEEQIIAGRVQEVAANAASLEAFHEEVKTFFAVQQGNEPGRNSIALAALRSLYRPAWELALQRWMEATAPGARTYMRASRRGGDRTDIVLAGRKREGWTLNIVLDTSGSMYDELARVLGAIASFCESVNVDSVRLLQCDVEVTEDAMVTPEQLNNYRITGLGGSDMSPAMLRLADDPEVEAVIVLTDGLIYHPPQAMPYNVLWVLTNCYGQFNPGYGQVIELL